LKSLEKKRSYLKLTKVKEHLELFALKELKKPEIFLKKRPKFV
jgi:hypothetical protein